MKRALFLRGLIADMLIFMLPLMFLLYFKPSNVRRIAIRGLLHIIALSYVKETDFTDVTGIRDSR